MINEHSAEASHIHTKRVKTATRTSDSDSESADPRGSSASFEATPTGNDKVRTFDSQPIPESFWGQSEIKSKPATPQMPVMPEDSDWIDPSQFPKIIKLLNIYYLLFRRIKR